MPENTPTPLPRERNARMTKFDTVYYWIGGTERGEWRECPTSDSVEDTLRDIERMGYVGVRGKRSIGAPEGAPVSQLAARDARIAARKGL